MGDSVVEVFGTGWHKPEVFVPLDEIRLGIEHQLTGEICNHVLHESSGQPLPSPVDAGGHPADSMALAVIEQSEVGDRAVRTDPDVSGAGVGVASVQLGIRARLLDNEDIDPQPYQFVKLPRAEVVERSVYDLGHRPKLPRVRPLGVVAGPHL